MIKEEEKLNEKSNLTSKNQDNTQTDSLVTQPNLEPSNNIDKPKTNENANAINELKPQPKLPSQAINDNNNSNTLIILIFASIILFLSIAVAYMLLNGYLNSNVQYVNTASLENSCIDSDNGEDIYLKGTAQNQFETHIDQCGKMIGNEDNTFILYEAWCADNGGIGINRIECEHGCYDGACINKNNS